MKIGVDLGGSHIAIGVVDNNGRIIEKFEKRLKGIEKKKIKETIVRYIIENVQLLSKKTQDNRHRNCNTRNGKQWCNSEISKFRD